jgi:hypothetical protein
MFFQKPLGIAMKSFESELSVAISQDINKTIKQFKLE